MSAVLGVSCHHHDAAAALVVDGVVVAAIQEERLSRRKNDPSLPKRAIRAVCELGCIDPAALDRVVFYDDPYASLERVLVHQLRVFPRAWRSFPRALQRQLGEKLWVLDDLARLTGVPRSRVGFVGHHESHAASAFLTTGWQEAAVLTVDAVGGPHSTALWHGTPNGLQLLDAIAFPHSLGLLYAAITAWLGFRVNEGEYKVMGLAAFGEPHHREVFEQLIQLLPDGSFTLDPAPFGHFADPERGFGPGLEALLGPARAPRKPWNTSDPADRARADVAATLQAVVEDALLGLARRVKERTGADRLCLAGGVALNCVANRRLEHESGFVEVSVHPAAGDAGGALGAALLGAVQLGDRLVPLESPFLGLPTESGHAADVARAAGLTVETVADPAAAIGACLADGKIVARCTHRTEWGPRALGARSLLAAPHQAHTRERLNRVVKHRELFRPFAPAVRREDFADHFHGAPNALTDVMCTVRDVKTPERLAAVTHVDGTARVQSVGEGPLRPILEHMPVVLNTSLNGPGEPICGSAVDAVGFFLRHPVDALFIDAVRVTR